MRKRMTIMALTGLLILFSGLFAYATLGESRRKSAKRKTQLSLSSRVAAVPGTFSLKSGYEFRGRSVIREENTSVRVNTVVSLQKGNHIYSLPLKREILTHRVKLSIGNQSLRRP